MNFVQKTVVLVKPDGVKRGLVGDILSRFERVSMKIVAMKMVWVDAEVVGKHYADKDEYHMTVGTKTLENYQKYGFDAGETLGTKDPVEIGKLVRKWNMEFLSSGPVVAMLLSGENAVEIVRKMIGHTFPQVAAPGTIRGDYSFESAMGSNLAKRSTKNLIHASGSVEEAEFETKLWFRENEIYDYKRVGEDL